jgi:hypothetical protein
MTSKLSDTSSRVSLRWQTPHSPYLSHSHGTLNDLRLNIDTKTSAEEAG